MGYGMESGGDRSLDSTSEISESIEVNDSLAEVAETPEDFDDCTLNEVDESGSQEVNTESLETAEDDFEDCEAKVEEMEEENPELAEEDYDEFDDCGSEEEDQYVAEVAYVTDGEIDEAEAGEELQEAYDDCEDPEDMDQLEENANENENIEVVNAEVVERPEDAEMGDEVTEGKYEEAQEEMDEAEEELEAQQEAAQEYREASDNQIDESEDNVPEGTDNINDETAEGTDESDEVDETDEDTSEVEESDEAAEDSEEVTESDEDLNEAGEVAETDDEEVADEITEVDGAEDSEEVNESDEGAEEAGEVAEADGEETEDSEKVYESDEEADEAGEVTETDDEEAEDTEEVTEADGEEDSEEVTESDEEEAETDEVAETDDEEAEDTEEVSESDEETEDSEEVTESDEEETETDEVAETDDEETENFEEAYESDEETEDSEEVTESDEETDDTDEVAETDDEETENFEEAYESDEETEDSEEVTESDEETDDTDEVAETDDEEAEDTEAAYESGEETENSEEVCETDEDTDELEGANITLEDTEDSEDAEPDLEAEELKAKQEAAEEGLESSGKASQYNRTSELQELTAERDDHAEALAQAKEEADSLARENADKFDAVMKADRGTASFKQSLQEYNASRDRQADLEAQIKDMETTQKELNSKTVELRNAQLQKGEVAVAASVSTLAMSEGLQDRFDEAYYGNGNAKELKQIQADNSKLIEEMSSERDSVKLAMDAKMSEIRDYVNDNNLERYDTERDPHYQQLLLQYRDLESTYGQLKYNVIKLDENNIQISEVTGTDYESVQRLTGSRVSEVNEGTDVPGRTNYFVDEVRAKEVLSPFRQSNWENLSVREQKAAVEQLAQYNADILGIDNPPAIVYYKNDDPTDFGGFSSSQHTIFINELNMRDAAETADTISHEYRHCYQHERAELLENDRDLEFKEGFDNYISPENNYLAYKNQLVEQDAREYAEAVKDKISTLEGSDSSVIKTSGNSSGNVKSFETLSPEKGAVFDETSVRELPEDFEKKIVEVRDPKEVFEVAELQEIKDHVTPAYENGVKIAERVEEFNTYKEHHEIDDGHIGKVHEKSLQASDVLEASFKEESYDGLYSSTIDRKSLEMMALYHDTGMDGNVPAESFDQAKAEYLATPGRREAYVQSQMGKNPDMTVEQANSKYENEAYEGQFRKEHSVQSAIHALRDREFIESHGADADRVALGCLAHSKSNSGVGNLADEGQWNDAVNRLQSAVAEFNRTHPDEQISFSDSFLRRLDGSFDKESLAEMRSEALCLRIGDANGHDSGSHTSQNGKEIEFDLTAWKEVQDNFPEALESKITRGDCSDFKVEVENAHVEIDGKVLDDSNDPSGFSRMFAVGEGNFKSINLEMADGVPTQKFELESGDAYPLSTQYCILERLKEYNTAKVEPQFEIERPAGMSDAKFKDYKAAQIDAMPKIDFVAEIDLGQADGRTIASYEAFADRVNDQYGINVIVKNQPLDIAKKIDETGGDASFSKNELKKVLEEDNVSLEEFNKMKLTDVSMLSTEQVAEMKKIREAVPKIDERTYIQKTIPAEDIEKYIGENGYNSIGGYVARYDDVAHIKGYGDVVESSRLDYTKADGTRPYPENGDAYGYIKFKTSDVDKIGIPYGKVFGGTNTDAPPCTLNGFTGSRNGEVVPEWTVNGYMKPKIGAELHEVKNGKDTVVAVFNGKYFKRVSR